MEKTAGVFRSVVKKSVNLSGLRVKNDFCVFPFAKTLRTGIPSKSSGGTRILWSAFLKFDLACRKEESMQGARNEEQQTSTVHT